MSQQNKSTLQAAINTQLADNTSGDISAADVRDNLINMTDSLVFNEGTGQTITGGLTVTGGITGSLQGTATTASYVVTAQTASYVLNAVSASRAATASITDTATKLTITGAGGVGTLYPTLVGTSAGDLNVSTKASNLSFNQTTNQLFATSVSSSFTGSLLGTSTSSSFAISSSRATSASFASTASYIPVAQTLVDANLPLVLINGNSLVKDQYDSITYNPLNNILTVVANTDFTGPITSLSSISSTGGFTGSLQGTASLSNATIGAGNPSNVNGGEIQFRGSTGVGGTGGKNIYSSAFKYDATYDGITLGDPNTTFGYGSGNYFIALGYDAIAAGYAVAFGSSSLASGEGSFSHGKSVTAGGSYSHAEGQSSSANGDYSHAEGLSVTANGEYSHAEGWSTVSQGNYSHAEGFGTNATGVNSHAEGQYSTAKGNGSHAEGVNTNAVGPFSHAEGAGTIASGSFQHVGGRFNTQGDNTSLFIIGNGDVDAETRSDAFKVRMSGSIVLPTTSSGQPGWTGTNGEIIAGTDNGGNKVLWVYLGGSWLTSSLGI